MVHLRCMPLDVSRRSPHALFLAGKQHEPDGAAGLHPHLANPARRVNHHHGVDPVVFRARAQIPRIQMRTQQHDFFRPLAAANLPDHVARFVRPAGLVRQIQAHAHLAGFRQPRQTRRMLARYHRDRHGHNSAVDIHGVAIKQAARPRRFEQSCGHLRVAGGFQQWAAVLLNLKFFARRDDSRRHGPQADLAAAGWCGRSSEC